MKSLRIDFTSGSPKLVLAEQVSGLGNVAQSCLVNVGTFAGSDALFADRGTSLLADAVGGRLLDINSAQHRANFAAGYTLLFQRTYQTADDPARLASVTISATAYDGTTVQMEASFTSVSGETLGINPNL